MKKITSLPKLSGKRVIVRVDYNVPLKGSKIVDASRIDSTFATLDTVLKKGGTPLIISHIGDGTPSLRPVATYLSKKYKIVFITKDIRDKNFSKLIEKVPPRTLILLENIRRYKEEEKNTKLFAKLVASFGAYYVNEAFPVSHRAHASLVGIPQYLPSYAGIQFGVEVAALSKARTSSRHPFLFILGGAKFDTKLPLISTFASRVDEIVIAGALLNDFYKVAGFEVGKSVVEKGFDVPIQKLLTNPKLLLPTDVVVMRGNKSPVLSLADIQKSDTIVDIGPRSIELIATKIKKAKYIIWNGPTGWYEKGFTKGTTALAQAIAKSTAHSVLGGGDTGAVIQKVFKNRPLKNIFVSTGGGATLEYLAKGMLPGIEALG